MDTISAKELDRYIDRQGYLIVDLRSRTEFLQGHIRGAVNAPDGRFRCVPECHRKDILILYCDRGARSMSAARELEKMGWKTRTVVGGIRAYRGKNMVKDMPRKAIDRVDGGH
ncbi:MAG: rhodanese-like domain-containing protein [Clostridiales bacterium]|nr:rhodanese-like domain-containing protein [Clostridiales bacterium]